MIPSTPPVHDAAPQACTARRQEGALPLVAGELLNASGALLEGALLLGQAGVMESSRVTDALRNLLARLGTDAACGEGAPTAPELAAAATMLRQHVLSSSGRVVRLQRLIGAQTIPARFRWRPAPADATMRQLHLALAELARSAALAAVGGAAANTNTSVVADRQAVAQGIASMVEVARQHHAVAEQTLHTVERLHRHAAELLRIVTRAQAA